MPKCKVCKKAFKPTYNTMQKVCSVDCALVFLERDKDKKQQVAIKQKNKETKARKEALQTIPALTKIAQKAFNDYIRARDEGQLCISCQKPLPTNQGYLGYDAGHYRSVGAAPHLRFVENNCHGQCKRCNNHLSGNIVEYRKNLIHRIGEQALLDLEADHQPRHYRHDELREISQMYRQKTKGLNS